MQKTKFYRFLFAAVLAVGMFAMLFGAAVPGYASTLAQEPTPLPVEPGDDTIVVTQIVPQTGGSENAGNDGVFLNSWTLLVILGVVVVVLLIALLARGSGHTHVD